MTRKHNNYRDRDRDRDRDGMRLEQIAIHDKLKLLSCAYEWHSL